MMKFGSNLIDIYKNRIEVQLQEQVADCGLTSLAMIASYFGKSVDASMLRHRFNFSSGGTTLFHLVEVAKELDLSTRALQFEIMDINKLVLPCIIHWSQAHFVVLEKVDKSHITIVDPAMGRRRYSRIEALLYVTGYALEIWPSVNFEKCKYKSRIGIFDFIQKNPLIWKELFKSILLSLIIALFTLVSPFYIGLTIDEVVPSKDTDFLQAITIIFSIVFIFDIFSKYLRGLIHIRLSSSFLYGAKQSVFRHILSLPMKFFQQSSSASIITRFNHLGSVKMLFEAGTASAVLDGLFSFIGLGLMFYIDSILATIAVIVVTILIAVRILYIGIFQKAQEAYLSSYARDQECFLEAVNSIQSLKLIRGGAISRLDRWSKYLSNTVGDTMILERHALRYSSAIEFLTKTELVIMVYVGADHITEGNLTIGLFFAYYIFKQNFFSHMETALETFKNLQIAQVSLQSIKGIVEHKPDELEKHIKKHHGFSNFNSLTANSIFYRYGQNESWVLQDANLSIGSCEKKAIIGPSGSGKTSFLKILVGLISPEEGEVCLNGVNLEHLGRNAVLDHIAAVFQDDVLLTGTITENICSFENVEDFSRIQTAAQKAGIHEEIEEMTSGYNTIVQFPGIGLSSGQLKRLLIARALYTEPSLLLLDEPTSSLDEKSASKIRDTINALDVSVICATHDQSLVNELDQVLLISKSNITKIV